MINCRNCINWVDESLEQIEADETHAEHIFMGCRIYGFRENNTSLPSCPHYVQSENLFTICHSCQITVPKVCVSLGECVNCTDTDLFCIDHCIGGDQRKYCTHFVRLSTEGAHLIDQDQAFDLFPILGMSEKHRKVADSSETASNRSPHDPSHDE
jgi:hypothetical protein